MDIIKFNDGYTFRVSNSLNFFFKKITVSSTFHEVNGV